jgi:uncharacterized protein (TIGR02246 family)
MKNLLITAIFSLCFAFPMLAQTKSETKAQEKQILTLIAQYSQARETRDPDLLKSILTEDTDQLVSSGEWRRGVDAALTGMMQSSASRPGSRTLTVETIRFLGPTTAIADARYEIENTDETIRKMWSTFIVSFQENQWKIAAIRNMLPAK